MKKFYKKFTNFHGDQHIWSTYCYRHWRDIHILYMFSVDSVVMNSSGHKYLVKGYGYVRLTYVYTHTFFFY